MMTTQPLTSAHEVHRLTWICVFVHRDVHADLVLIKAYNDRLNHTITMTRHIDCQQQWERGWTLSYKTLLHTPLKYCN